MKWFRRRKRPVATGPEAIRKARRKAFIRRRFVPWKIWGIIALFLAPLTLQGFVVTMVRLAGWEGFVKSCKESPYCELWYAPWGTERQRLSEPLEERERRIWDGVVAVARSKGFVFQEPEVRQTNEEADRIFSYDRTGGDILGMAFGGNRILLNSRHMRRMPDEYVAVLMAHELGHRVDHQTERVGHLLFERLRYAESQEFADGFAEYLVGPEQFRKFEDWRHGGFGFPEVGDIFDECRTGGVRLRTMLPSGLGGVP